MKCTVKVFPSQTAVAGSKDRVASLSHDFTYSAPKLKAGNELKANGSSRDPQLHSHAVVLNVYPAAIALLIALSAAVTSTSTMAQCGSPSNENGTAGLELSDTPNKVTSDGRTEGNTAARIAGGVGGAVLGAVLTQGAGGLAKTVAIVGLGYLGQTIGDIATRNVIDQNGNPVVKVGTDSQGRPIYESVGMTPVRAGSGQLPPRVTQEVYENAVARASSSTPLQASPSANGKTFKALDQETHCGMYKMMVETAATRAVAQSANTALDGAELAREVAPGNKSKASAFSAANQTFKDAFLTYSASYQQTTRVISVAQKNGYDVSAQHLLMALLPGDLKVAPGADIHWPGVDERIRELTSVEQK